MNAKEELILSRELAEEVCRALGLESDRVFRVILDFQVNEFPIVYVQMLGDSRLLHVDWERGLHGATVTILDDMTR